MRTSFNQYCIADFFQSVLWTSFNHMSFAESQLHENHFSVSCYPTTPFPVISHHFYNITRCPKQFRSTIPQFLYIFHTLLLPWQQFNTWLHEINSITPYPGTMFINSAFVTVRLNLLFCNSTENICNVTGK